MVKVFEKISYKWFELSMENLESLADYKLSLQGELDYQIEKINDKWMVLEWFEEDNFEFKLEDFDGYRLEVQYKELEFVEYDKCVCNDILGTYEYYKDDKLVKFEQRYSRSE